MRLAILGGSSPFTLGLFRALRNDPIPELREIVLQGRNAEALATIRAFGSFHLDHIRVEASILPREACTGADVILHQVRYGGLEGRNQDEIYAISCGLPPDESLGPSALRAAVRMQDDLAQTNRVIREAAPSAQVINLTNPLSLSTSMMHADGLNVVGICELPGATGISIRLWLGIKSGYFSFRYSGLNHRGVLYDFYHNDKDLTTAVMSLASVQEMVGLREEELRQFGAVPTKYFRLFSKREPISPLGRARALEALRAQLLREIKSVPTDWPASLDVRPQPWWPLAVVPLLRGLSERAPSQHIVSLPGEDGISREGWCEVSRDGIRWIGSMPPRNGAARFLRDCERHEAACLKALVTHDPCDAELADKSDPLRSC
jgi:6-phospho-beta-glucosidase